MARLHCSFYAKLLVAFALFCAICAGFIVLGKSDTVNVSTQQPPSTFTLSDATYLVSPSPKVHDSSFYAWMGTINDFLILLAQEPTLSRRVNFSAMHRHSCLQSSDYRAGPSCYPQKAFPGRCMDTEFSLLPHSHIRSTPPSRPAQQSCPTDTRKLEQSSFTFG